MYEYEPNLKLQNLVNKPNDSKKYKKTILVLAIVIVLLILILLLIFSSKQKVVEKEVVKKPSLSFVASELLQIIDDNDLDGLDAFGIDGITRVAINNICKGVNNCKEIKGEAVEKYVNNILDKKVTFSNINCELNDGPLYIYDSKSNMFVWNDNHPGHGGIVSSSIYRKVNSIKRDGNKYVLVLNKLYYSPMQSEYIASEPTFINKIYDAKDYLKVKSGGEEFNLNKLISDYDNDFDKLKNKGTRYRYTFDVKDNNYILEKYEVLSNEE